MQRSKKNAETAKPGPAITLEARTSMRIERLKTERDRLSITLAQYDAAIAELEQLLHPLPEPESAPVSENLPE